MRNVMKRKALLGVLLALMMAVGFMPVAAYADGGTVEYQGHADGFVFTPGTDASPTDLFPGLKDAVPGDTLTDSVEVVNNGAKPAKIYLKALEPADQEPALLPELNLTVKQGETVLNEGTAAEKGALADNVLLAELAPGEKVTLDLELSMPIELGNEYQDATAFINWQFTAEEEEDPVPDDGDDDQPGDNPGGDDPGKVTPKKADGKGAKTGDPAMMGLALLLVGAAGAGAAASRKK